MTEQKTKQKTVQKTARKATVKKDKVTAASVVRTMKSTVRKAGVLVWKHRDYVAHGAMVACGVMLMVGGANKLVFGRFFPK